MHDGLESGWMFGFAIVGDDPSGIPVDIILCSHRLTVARMLLKREGEFACICCSLAAICLNRPAEIYKDYDCIVDAVIITTIIIITNTCYLSMMMVITRPKTYELYKDIATIVVIIIVIRPDNTSLQSSENATGSCLIVVEIVLQEPTLQERE